MRDKMVYLEENEKNQSSEIKKLESDKNKLTQKIQKLELELQDLQSLNKQSEEIIIEYSEQATTYENKMSQQNLNIKEAFRSKRLLRTELESLTLQVEEYSLMVEESRSEKEQLESTFLLKIESLEARLKKREGGLNSKIEELVSEKLTLIQKQEDLMKDLEQSRSQVNSYKMQFMESSQKIERFEFNSINKIEQLEAASGKSQEELKLLRLKVSELEALLESKTKVLRSVKEECEELNSEIEQLRNKYKSKVASKDTEIEECQRRIEKLRGLGEEKDEKVMDLTELKNNYAQDLERVSAELRDSSETIKILKSQKIEIQAEIKVLKVKMMNFEGSIVELTESLRDTRDKNGAYVQENQVLRTKLEQKNSQNSTNQSNLDSIKVTLEAQTKLYDTLEMKYKTVVTENEGGRVKQQQDYQNLLKKYQQLQKDYVDLENESKSIIESWDKERSSILEDNQRLDLISSDRLKELEKKSWLNEKLLIKLALCYAELERMHKFSKGASNSPLPVDDVQE